MTPFSLEAEEGALARAETDRRLAALERGAETARREGEGRDGGAFGRQVRSQKGVRLSSAHPVFRTKCDGY